MCWTGALHSYILRTENFASFLFVKYLPYFQYFRSIDGSYGSSSRKAMKRSRKPGNVYSIVHLQFSLFLCSVDLQIKDDSSFSPRHKAL